MFQASGKTTKSGNVGSDFNDLKLIKQAENAAIKKIQTAQKKVEMLIAKSENDLIEYEEKSLAALSSKLETKLKLEEKTAQQTAKKIKSEGEIEAARLKEEVQPRIPKAVEHIVNMVIIK